MFDFLVSGVGITWSFRLTTSRIAKDARLHCMDMKKLQYWCAVSTEYLCFWEYLMRCTVFKLHCQTLLLSNKFQSAMTHRLAGRIGLKNILVLYCAVLQIWNLQPLKITAYCQQKVAFNSSIFFVTLAYLVWLPQRMIFVDLKFGPS